MDAVAYMHSKGIVHRDLKPENIMLDVGDRIKIVDFGCALDKSKKGPYWIAGTLAFLPPENLAFGMCGEPYESIDIWTVGLLTVELLIGYNPYFSLVKDGMLEKATMRFDVCVEELPCSNELKDFVRRCLIRKPDLRPSAAELLKHPFIQGRGYAL